MVKDPQEYFKREGMRRAFVGNEISININKLVIRSPITNATLRGDYAILKIKKTNCIVWVALSGYSNFEIFGKEYHKFCIWVNNNPATTNEGVEIIVK